MRITILMAALAVVSVPGIAMAECSWGSAHEMTMSCADGTTWDAETRSCVATASS